MWNLRHVATNGTYLGKVEVVLLLARPLWSSSSTCISSLLERYLMYLV